MKGLAIVLCFCTASLGFGVARADGAAPQATQAAPQPPAQIDTSNEQQFNLKMQLPNPRLRRKIAIGLLISSAVFLALGSVFVGAAKSANDKIFSNMTYHPSQENHRLSFEVTDVVMFTAAAVTFAPGMVLMWDR